jgi:hypothetical protein
VAAHSVVLLVRGRHAELNKAYGPQTLDEEIEAEAGEVLAELEAETRAAAQGAKP